MDVKCGYSSTDDNIKIKFMGVEVIGYDNRVEVIGFFLGIEKLFVSAIKDLGYKREKVEIDKSIVYRSNNNLLLVVSGIPFIEENYVLGSGFNWETLENLLYFVVIIVTIRKCSWVLFSIVTLLFFW